MTFALVFIAFLLTFRSVRLLLAALVLYVLIVGLH